MNRTSALTLLLALTISAVADVAAAVDPEENISLAGSWKLNPGDDAGWARPDYDDAAWESIDVPSRWPDEGFPETGQFAWYRLEVPLSPALLADRDHLGIRIGAIRSAYELYVGGQHLGGVGELPPNPAINYDKLRVYEIPESLVTDHNTLVIALRVWGGSDLGVRKSGGGAYNDEFLIGNYTTLVRSLDMEQVPKLIFASLFLAVGIFFLYLYYRNSALPSFLWFGVTAIIAAPYIVTQSQWKYQLGLTFITYEKIETFTFCLFLVLLTQLIWTIIDRPFHWLVRAYQFWMVGIGLTVALVPGIEIHHYLRVYWQVSLLLMIVPTFWVVLAQVKAGHRDARLLLYGLIVFVALGINDLLVNMQVIHTLRVMPIGFLAVIASMVVSLANKFTDLLRSLEAEVSARTLALDTANRELEGLVRKDPLTNLLNRRGFVDEAEIERQRFIRNVAPFSLILADIDHFKRFNDDNGHACGDHVLKSVATLLEDHLRDVDRVARWGGEEFVLLLPDTNEAGAVQTAEKLREHLARATFSFEGMELSITMTFGVAVYMEGESLDECLVRADTALYSGKEQGRNTVVLDQLD